MFSKYKDNLQCIEFITCQKHVPHVFLTNDDKELMISLSLSLSFSFSQSYQIPLFFSIINGVRVCYKMTDIATNASSDLQPYANIEYATLR